MHVGTKLREKRREKGMSQDELAKAVGLTFQQVQKYEKGSNRISCSKLHDFAKLLKTNVGYFFQELDVMNYPEIDYPHYSFKDECAEFNADNMSAELAELIENFKSIKDSNARCIISNLAKYIRANAK